MPKQEKTLESKIARAALKLAAKKPWPDVTIGQIAKAANVSLPSLKKLFPDTAAILPAIVRLMDEEMTENAKSIKRKAPAHDRLFEAMMARFDALQTHRAGILSITEACRQTPALAMKIFQSQGASMQQVLRLAHFDTNGAEGLIRQIGLFGIYQMALRRWLHDDSPDMAKTMSILDRGLRRGGNIISFLQKHRPN